MDFADLEEEEAARGCTAFSALPEDRPFQSLAEVRIGSSVRVLHDGEAAAAACARAGIGPLNQQKAREAAGLLVKVLERDADQTLRCAVPSAGEAWLALGALQPAQVCVACGCPLAGASCDRCGRQSASGASAPPASDGAAGAGDWGADHLDAWLDPAELEAEIERRVCAEAEAEVVEAGGVVGALLEVEADGSSGARVCFADAVNKVWASCAEVCMSPEPVLATFGRRIIYIFKLLTVILHVRFLPHARAHFQTFVDAMVKPRTGLRDVIGRWLQASAAEKTKRSGELTRTLEEKMQAMVRCLELAVACRPIPANASSEMVTKSLDQLSRLVLGGTTASKDAASQEEHTAAWQGWEAVEPDGQAPVPMVLRTGSYTVEVWSAGRRDADGLYTVTHFDQVRHQHRDDVTFTKDGGASICQAHGVWWLVRDGKALYATSTGIPKPRNNSDDWLSRPFPMMRGIAVVKVSLGASTRLLADLRAAYADAAFQREYQDLRLSGGGHVPYTVSVQARILPKYGFEGSLAGVLEMRRHTCFWCPGDAPSRKLLRDIHSLLEYGRPFAAPTHGLDEEREGPRGPAAELEGQGPEQRFVLVRPVNGLCNRLSAIVAAWLLAKDLGRKLVVDWQCVKCCNCPWERLMRVPEEIQVLTEELLGQHQCLEVGLDLLEYFHAGADTSYKPPEKVRSLAVSSARNLKKLPCGSVCGPAAYVDVDSQEWKALSRLQGVPFHELPLALQLPCVSVLAFDDFYPTGSDFRAALAERSALLNCLRPTPGVLERVLELPPGTVGVHVRRTDHWEACTFSPEELFVERLQELGCGGSRSCFLATDCPELEGRLRQRYGSSLMVLSKRTLDRSTPEGIEDAFADLLTLASCSELVGSFESTFSRTAALFRCVPLAVVYRSPGDGRA